MKCKLLSALVVGMICITSLGWSQSITVDLVFNVQNPVLDPLTSTEIPMGSAIMIMAAGGSNPMGADGSRPFFAAAGDTVLDLVNSPPYSNPSGYFDSTNLNAWGYTTFFTMPGFDVDLRDYSAGETVNMFVRVFNYVLSDTGFDVNGNFIQFADGKPKTDPFAWSNLYYFDTPIIQYTIPTNLTLQDPLTFNISNPNGMTDWNANGIGAGIWAPVPEPGAMMLMASGILLLVRRIKK